MNAFPQNAAAAGKVVKNERPSAARTCLVQIGFYGDILNILPVAKDIADAEGGKVAMVVHDDYKDILEAVSYVEPIIWNGRKLDGPGAARFVSGLFSRIFVTRLPEQSEPKDRKCQAYNIESWRYAGYADRWTQLPKLNLDRRDYASEQALIEAYALDGKDFILVAPLGNSSPFNAADELMGEIHRRWAKKAKIVDMRRVRAKKFQDLLGMMDKAIGLVTVDTGHLHLAAASKVPVIALISDRNGIRWYGSQLRYTPALAMRYHEFFSRREDIHKTIGKWFESKKPVSIVSPGPRLLTVAVPKSTAIKTFYHSGDLGDIIYSLPTVKALGGGVFYLGPDAHPAMGPREAMTPARADLLIRLLKSQPYITAAEYRASSKPIDVNLNDFRDELVARQLDLQKGFNLARVPLKHWGLPLDLDKRPWLTVPACRVAPVVVSRSPRYHSNEFNWTRILRTYVGTVTFVGTRQEHAVFCKEVGYVPYTITEDLYDAARVIAGADLFIGNQSCPFAIAIGLGKRVILEDCPNVSNCLFDRPDFTKGCTSATELPDLSQLTITAPIEDFTGFGQLVHSVCRELYKKGIRFSVVPSSYSDNLTPVSDLIRKRIVKKPLLTNLLFCPVLNIPERLASGDILFTMWESSRIEPHIVEAINKRAAVVIVPNKWNATGFAADGVTVPIRVVPLGVDPAVYHYIPAIPSNVFRFGTAGRLAHAGIRKGVEETIECFEAAFPSEQDVELQIKIFEDCKLDGLPQDNRIVCHRRFMPTAELVDWYAGLDCFVTLTKGEGWGLHIQQAMAIGRPVIAPRHGGQAEFVDDDNAYCCRYRLETPTWPVYKNSGPWCIPDKDHCVELMRRVYTNRQEAISIGKQGSLTVAGFTWQRTVDELVAVMREFGKL